MRRRASGGSPAAAGDRPAGTGAVVLGALIGALLVLVAQFVALYYVRVATSSSPVKTVGTGANHGWAPLPIALVCLALVLAVFLYGNRTALLGLVVLGIATLVIALVVDWPDVHATGLIGSSAGQFQRAANSPAAGLYLETLGAVLLLVSGGVGFLMLGGAAVRIALPAVRRRPRSATGSPTGASAARRTRTATASPATEPAPPAATASPATEPAPRAATEPGEPPSEPSEASPTDPAATPPAPKGPLNVGDAPRRRWSAS